MKLTIELTKPEAQQILGRAIREGFGGNVTFGLAVTDVEWTTYGSRVTVTLEKEDPAEVPAPATPEAAAA